MRPLSPEIRSLTTHDGTSIAYRHWDADQPQGHVVIVHGIISHSGWYGGSATHLARSGFTVDSLDRRGSGLNFEKRGDVDRFETWVEDVHQHLDQIPASLPVILIGISWGGLLVTAVARRYPQRQAGIGLLCPGFFSRKGTSSLQHQVVRFASHLGLASRHFPVPLRAPELFTNTDSWRQYIRDDPFTLRKVSLRLATASADLYAETTRTPVAVKTPTLLMLGGQDAIIRNEQVRDFVKQYYGESLTIREYPDAAHTLEFEPDRSAYLDDLAKWCHSVSVAKRVP